MTFTLGAELDNRHATVLSLYPTTGKAATILTARHETDRQMPVDGTMSYEDMIPFLSENHIRLIETRLPTHVAGLYDEENRTILIDSTMSPRQKRCTLVHELYHWVHADRQCSHDPHSKIERRTRRETALLLVDPKQYMEAETMFDGEVRPMTVELDVTIQVLEDYRCFLAERFPSR